MIDATGTLPMASAHSLAPSSATRSSAAPAERVSFQSSAGRTTAPSASRQTIPCCCPATAMASTSDSPPAWSRAACRASHQPAGSTSVPGGCGARPLRTSSPLSASRITTVHDCVDESTPATSPIAYRPFLPPEPHFGAILHVSAVENSRTAPKCGFTGRP